MRRHTFEVLRGESVIHLETPAPNDCPKEMWRKVAELSVRFHIPGTRIIVRDDHADVVVSIGVVSALKLAENVT